MNTNYYSQEAKIATVESLRNSDIKYSEIREDLNKMFDSTAAVVLKAIDILGPTGSCKGKERKNAQETQLDQKQRELQKQELVSTLRVNLWLEDDKFIYTTCIARSSR